MMEAQYQPEIIERDAQSRWEADDAYAVSEDPNREAYYCLSMFPYPSGKFHMGHARNYTIGDVIARFQRMQGKNVLQPMGWDAFGLPAENAAIKNQVPPARWTYANIDAMRGQFRRLGYAYDWSREVTTCRPEYYRWEQAMFVRLIQKGLAYRKDAEVNWDPVDQTVLANEQVVDGRGWRSGALVERRTIPQWFVRITAYAEELLEGLDRLDEWPDAVKTMQRHWIGRSQGLQIAFDVPGHDPVEVFTTRPDTLYGATYLAVAPQHPLAVHAAASDPRVAEFIERCTRVQVAEAAMETMEKEGMPIGLEADHPLSGKPVPIWVANFVLMSYGTGAVMSVPAHDERDWAFARRYELPIVQVVARADGGAVDLDAGAFTDHGILINSADFDGLDYDQACEAIAGRLGVETTVNYRLRDWGVSRQRYWGCPIPVIYCDECGTVPVPEEDLPVVLPEDVEFTGVGSPLKDMPEFLHVDCPQCGRDAQRETDTFDTFVESSWYYARYASPDCDSAMVDQRARYWLPVDQYIGGIEHAVMHLLYFRFWHRLLRDQGLVTGDEPATRLLTQGMVVAETFFRDEADGSRTYFAPEDLTLTRDDKGRVVGATAGDGNEVQIGRVEKMSKSKNNGVDPDAMIRKYGADTVRLFAMFGAPPDQSLEWSESGIEGMHRFLRNVWRQVYDHVSQGPAPTAGPPSFSPESAEIRRLLHETIAKVSDDVGRRYKFNTAIAAMMEFINGLGRYPAEGDEARWVRQEAWETITLMLCPYTPHLSDALWRELGHSSAVIDEPWPQVDDEALAREEVEIVVQVNGKLRGRIAVPPGSEREQVENASMAEPNVARFLQDKTVRKVIVVPDKLINIVAT